MSRRKCEVMVEGNGWAEIEMKDLIKGDMFRLFEPDGKPVSFYGKTEFYAASTPKPDKNGMYNVDAATTLEEVL